MTENGICPLVTPSIVWRCRGRVPREVVSGRARSTRALPRAQPTRYTSSRRSGMASVRLLSWLLVASSSNLAAAMSVRWDGPLSRSRRAVTWGGLAAAACSRLLPACPASAQNLIPPGPYREEDYYGVLLSAWPGGGPAVPDSEKSDFLVEEVRARVRARVRVRGRVRVRVRCSGSG